MGPRPQIPHVGPLLSDTGIRPTQDLLLQLGLTPGSFGSCDALVQLLGAAAGRVATYRARGLGINTPLDRSVKGRVCVTDMLERPEKELRLHKVFADSASQRPYVTARRHLGGDP